MRARNAKIASIATSDDSTGQYRKDVYGTTQSVVRQPRTARVAPATLHDTRTLRSDRDFRTWCAGTEEAYNTIMNLNREGH